MVKLAVYDYISSIQGRKIYLNVLNNENIREIKEKILVQVKENLKNKDDSKIRIKKVKNKHVVPHEMTVDSLIVYHGAIVLDDSKALDDYNVSDIPEVSLSLYSKVDITIVISVLKGVSCFGIKYTPAYSFIIQNKIMFNMIDQQTVLEIKRKILAGWEFVNKKGQSLELDKLSLMYNGMELHDNLCQINEMEYKDKLKLKLIIPYGYKIKKL